MFLIHIISFKVLILSPFFLLLLKCVLHFASHHLFCPLTASQPDVSKLPYWFAYLEFEESQRDPIRTQKLYERALTGYALVSDVWTRYMTYLETALKGVPAVVMATYDRAVKHCPWSGSLWSAYIRASERSTQPHENIDALFQRAVYAGLGTADDVFDVYQSYTDALVRRGASSVALLRETYQKGVDHLQVCYVFKRVCVRGSVASFVVLCILRVFLFICVRA